MLVTHRSHPLGRRQRVRFIDTLDYDYIGLQAESVIYGPLREEAREVGKVIRTLTQVGGIYHACRMVSAKFGNAVVPESVALSLKNGFELSIIQLESRLKPVREIVVHIDEKRMNESERALLHHLRCASPSLAADKH